MYQKYNGFTLIETLTAATILFVSLLIIVPSFVLVQQERKNMYTEINIIDHVRSELIRPTDNDVQLPYHMSVRINGKQAHMNFTQADNLKKGCVTWETNQSIEKNFCLYRPLE